MKILKETRTENKIYYELEEDYSVVAQEINRIFPQMAKKFNIPGFRKGKIPRNIFEQ